MVAGGYEQLQCAGDMADVMLDNWASASRMCEDDLKKPIT